MYRLSFCNINIITKAIIEVTFDEGVDIDLSMVDEFWCFVDENMEQDIFMLLNKTNSYSYQFDALITLSESLRIKSIAVVSYDELSKNTSDYMKRAFNKSDREVEIFDNREIALNWLKTLAAL